MSDTPRTDAELRKPIHDTGIHNNLTEFCRELERENAELRKDKARLDWLLDDESGVNVECVYTDKLGKYVLTWFDEREGIDKAMEEAQ